MSAIRDYGTARLALEARARLGECPLWSVAEQALYWIDVTGRALHRFDPESGRDASWSLPSEPGCIALAREGGLVAALRSGIFHFDPSTGGLRPVAAAPYDSASMRFNDGRCDAEGRLWIGTMFEPRTEALGAMYCLDRGIVREAWGPSRGLGVVVSNGLAFSRDSKAAFQSDTPRHVIYRFERDAATGEVSNRTVFARVAEDRGTPGYGGRPDGAALDAVGGYWSAQYEGARVLRFDAEGRVTGMIRVPALRPTMVAFGGRDLRTLYVTSASDGADGEERARFPLSGGIFECRVDVAGLQEPAYAGERG